MDKINKLKIEIERKKRELEVLENEAKNSDRNLAIKGLGEYTPEEKIQLFDILYARALGVVEEAERNGYVDEDTGHYLYEDVMTTLLARKENRGDFWKYFNGLTR